VGNPNLTFHAGTGYRHLLVFRGSGPGAAKTLPPHDVVGQKLADILPKGKGSEVLIGLMNASRDVLAGHEVNAVRRDLQQNPANMIWLWGQGERPCMVSFADKYHCTGAAISAVNLVRGIARLIGWDIIRVPGITGYTDTDYSAKGRYAVDALRSHDLVLVHVEAPDEAAHEGNLKEKMHAIEQVDREIVGPVMAAASELGGLRLLALPDHVTSVEQSRHLRGLVPFVIWGAGVEARSGLPFNEAAAAQSKVLEKMGHRLMGSFVKGAVLSADGA
jgi:2,3-bisphosphoglycerate-independent phosphoglycerate mutase